MIKSNGGVFGRNPTFNDVTVDGNLTVNGDIALGDDIVVADSLTVQGTTASTSTTTGALVVAGGVGIGGAVNIGGGMTVRPNASAPTSNVTIGPSAGAAMQSGATNNVCIGNLAGDAITDGDNLTFIGAGAGGAYTSGSSGLAATAVGQDALASSVSAIGATAIGANALALSTGHNVTAVGRGAGAAITSNGNATYIGNEAGLVEVDGACVIIGNIAAYHCVNANGSVIIGERAGRWFGSGSTASDNCTFARNSVLIGQNVRPGGNSQSNQIVIGHTAIGDGSNTTVIGNTSTTSTRIPAGNLTLTNGNLILGTAGNGIDFAATTDAAGMTSELLDDYEEGTYTPDLQFNGQNVSMTYTTQVGSYTKIGRMVHVTGRITLSNKGTSTGHATITFPFLIPNEASATGAFAVQVDAVTYGGSIMPALLTNNTRGHLYDVSEAGVLGQITEADFVNTSDIRWTATYRV